MTNSHFGTQLQWPFFEDSHRALHSALKKWVNSDFDQELVSQHDNCLDVSPKLVNSLGQAGWLQYAVPAPYGGKLERLDVRTLCLIRQTLAEVDGLLEFAFAMQGLGSGPISLFGNEHLKEKYLPKVAQGNLIAALAMSEADAGSDVAAISTTAKLTDQGYILNGEKTWISNAGIAGFYIVFARTNDSPGSKGLSALLVDADLPGCTVSEQIKTVSPHPLGSITFENCLVPKENLIGEEGKGFKVAMATLDVFRSTVGAAALGFARRALAASLERVGDRKLFGQNLSEFQITQQKLAEMITLIDTSALLVFRAAWAKDQGAPRITREAAMAKSYATDVAQKVIDHAVQLFGAKGVVSNSIPEILYRDIRPLRIYEGTSEVQKLIIARDLLENGIDSNC